MNKENKELTAPKDLSPIIYLLIMIAVFWIAV